MIVAFSGTRFGMTPAQRDAFTALITRLRPGTFLHGRCKGADEEASLIVASLANKPTVIGHPGASHELRSWHSTIAFSDWDEPPELHLARNRTMVDRADCLVAAPEKDWRQPRGGTWYTIGYAEKQGKPVYVVCPSGVVVRCGQGVPYEKGRREPS